MFGAREVLCRELADNYPPDEPLAVLVWTSAGIKELAISWNDPVTDGEIQAVLDKIGQAQGGELQPDGVAEEIVATLLAEVKREARKVAVPEELLSSLVTIAGQALWPEEWRALDERRPVPAGIVRKLADVARRCGSC